MAGPIANVVYKAKGEKGVTVGALWAKTWDDGNVSYSFSPKQEADQYGSLTFAEAEKLSAAREGFLNVYFRESVVVPDTDDDF